MKGKKKILLAVVLVLVMAVGITSIVVIRNRNKTVVKVFPVSSLNSSDWFDTDTSLTGTLTSDFIQEVHVSGGQKVKKIYVKKGDRVKAGDVIMQYELPGSEKTLKESNEKIAKTELQIKQAKELMTLEVEKQKKIGGGKSGIENAKNQYEQQIKALESSLELLKMDAKIAKEEIKEEQITASVNGVVTYVDSKAEGTYGTEGEAAVKIEGKKKNRFEANSKYASHCKEGDTVTIEVKGQEYKATIKRDKESTDSVYFYPKTKLNMEDGTVCSYQVILKERKDILYLPSSIVYSMGDKHVVYYEDANGLKSTKEVSVGETIDNFIEITGGLEENEQVIAN